MTFKKPSSKKDLLSSKVKSSAKILSPKKTASPKTLSKKTVSPRNKLPEVSVVNVIEQISKLLREEVHVLEKRKASGE